jgi:FkbM family methyltransferase
MAVSDDASFAKSVDMDEVIAASYNTKRPGFAYICGGLRRIAVNPDDKRARTQLLRHGIRYFSKMQALTYLINSTVRPDVYVDVGVNYGECLFAHPLYSRTKIVGFEANPSLVPLIRRSMGYNDDLADVTLIDKAMSDTSAGTIPFFVNTAWSGKSTGVAPAKDREDIRQIDVQTTTLDVAFSELSSWTTAVIKIDVEGFEPKVLRGGRDLFRSRGKNIIVLLEFDSSFMKASGDDAEEFFDYLQDIFDVYLVQRRSVRKIEGLEAIRELDPERSKVHCDLMLVRSDDPRWAAETVAAFTAKPLVDMANEHWGLGRKG